jgi:hypothetical protein
VHNAKRLLRRLERPAVLSVLDQMDHRGLCYSRDRTCARTLLVIDLRCNALPMGSVHALRAAEELVPAPAPRATERAKQCPP